MTEKKDKKRKNWGKIVLKLFAVLFLLLALLILFIRSPWGQDIIVSKATKYLSERTGTTISIDKLFLTFSGDVSLNGLYVEDLPGDTLLYSQALEVDIPFAPLIFGNSVEIDNLYWSGLTANVYRKDTVEGFNFQFLIDAFQSENPEQDVEMQNESEPLNIVLGTFNFSDFDLKFLDQVGKIDSQLKLGELELDMNTVDLEQLTFEIEEIELSNSEIWLQMDAQRQANTAPSPGPAPKLSLEALSLQNVNFNYGAAPQGLSTKVHLGEFFSEIPLVDLETMLFEVNELSLNNSTFLILQESGSANEDTKRLPASPALFSWPELSVELADIALQNNTIEYLVDGQKPVHGVFNPNALKISEFDLSLDNLLLQENVLQCNLEKLSFKEAAGILAKEIEVDLALNDTQVSLENFTAQINSSKIEGDYTLAFSSLNEALAKPENIEIEVLNTDFVVDLEDAFLFAPELSDIKEIKALSEKKISGALSATGKINALELAQNKITWGDKTQIEIQGFVKELTTPESLNFKNINVALKSSRSDMLRFVKEKDFGIKLPNSITCTATAQGNMNSMTGQLALQTSAGNIGVNGTFRNEKTIAFDVVANTKQLDLGRILQDERLGKLTLQLETDGKGKTLKSLNGDLILDIAKMTVNGYETEELNLKGQMRDGVGALEAKYKDYNLNAELQGTVLLDTILPTYGINLNVIGIDMQALGITPDPVRSAFKLQAEFAGDTQKFDALAHLDEGTVVLGQDAYQVGVLDFRAHVTPDSTSAQLDNALVNFDLQSNASPTDFGTAIAQHLSDYVNNDSLSTAKKETDVKLTFHARVSPSPILSDVFLGKIEELDTVKIDVNFDERSHLLDAFIDAPHTVYDGTTLDSLRLDLTTDQNNFAVDLGFAELAADPINLKSTNLKASGNDGQIDFNLHSAEQEETILNINAGLTKQDLQTRLHLDPENLIINRKEWQINAENEVLLSANKVEIDAFVISRKNRSLELTDDLPNVDSEHLAVRFDNFELNDLLGYLNPNDTLASGRMEGDFIVKNPFEKIGLLADLEINNLRVYDEDFGRLRLDATAKGFDNYDMELSLKEGLVDLDLQGGLVAKENTPEVNLKLQLNQFDFAALDGLTNNELTNASGHMTGELNLRGPLNTLKYDGKLFFENAKFKVKSINSGFALPEEELLVNETGFTLNNFKILDENQNEFILAGKILTPTLADPKFDLTVKAKDFQVLNASQEDNDYVYGVAAFDVDGKIGGDLTIPSVDATFVLRNATDLVYILPSGTAALESREGVVQFVNRTNPDAILTRTEKESAVLKGFDIRANLKVGKNAKLKVIIDPDTDDNFQVSGEGDLKFQMNPNGQMNLVGVYEVSSGSYEMNLYDIVSRRFELSPGSKVSWSGDPFDAKLDLRAIYKQEASSQPLMASVTSGMDPAGRTKFRRVLPFYVYLDVGGNLDAPELSFALDMPEDEQGAIGGQVYSQLQQVNQNEEELNKQVFSLLVLSRFYPAQGSDGSTGGIASVARDNINDALSDQLNIFSDKLLGQTGVQLDFGLDSYTDYQGESAAQRTQLDVAAKKTLFDERLTVSVGSEVDLQGGNETEGNAALIGKVSLEYTLTPDGRYRLKGFRRNEYQNVIDGQTIVSGVALNFTREFNKFSELWHALVFRDKSATENQETPKNLDR